MQQIAQGGILAHQGVATRNQDVPQLRILFKISHQPVQARLPVLFRPQTFQIEIQPFALKIIHPLAGSAKTTASATFRIRNQNGHFGIPPMNVASFGQQPSGHIGLSRFYDIFPFPGTYSAESFNKPFRIKHITPDSRIIITFSRRIQQRQIIGRNKNRHTFFLSLTIQTKRIGTQFISEHPVQFLRRFRSHGQMEMVIVPPVFHQQPFFCFRTSIRENITSGR